MSTVWVLMDHICEGDVIVGAFTSRKQAVDYLQAIKAFNSTALEFPEIIELALNPVRVPEDANCIIYPATKTFQGVGPK